MDAVQERLARWTAPDQTHPLAKREADLAALVDGDKTAWNSSSPACARPGATHFKTL